MFQLVHFYCYWAHFVYHWTGPRYYITLKISQIQVSYEFFLAGKMNKLTMRMKPPCCEFTHREEEPNDDVYRTPEMQLNGGTVRQLKDI